MTLPHHPGADPDCSHCHGVGLQIRRDELHARAGWCHCVPATCPACAGTGYVQVGEGFRAPVRPCEHLVLAARSRAFNAATIPRRYSHARLSDGEDATGSAAAAWQVVGAWARTVKPRGAASIAVDAGGFQPLAAERRPPPDTATDPHSYVLVGPFGSGKTHLACAAAIHLLLSRGLTVRFVEFSHLLADVRASFSGAGSSSVIAPLVAVDVLIVDELGKGRNTEFEGTVIDELVTRRYNASLPILATTNFEARRATGLAVGNAATPGGPQPTLGDRVGERVYSRLEEWCTFVEVSGEDHRFNTFQKRAKSQNVGRSPPKTRT